MKKRRLKPFIKISMVGLVVTLVVAIIPLVYTKTQSVSKLADDFTYVNDYIFDNYYPVVNSEEKILKPYTSEKVNVYKNFYEKDGNEEEQKNSIIYHEGIYMQNSGVTYTSDESFDIISSITGTVTDVSTDTLLGKTVEIRNQNDLITIYQSLSDVVVKKGDNVSSGQIIAKSGSSDLNKDLKNSLHFEIYKNSNVLNPEKYYGKSLQSLDKNE